MNDPRHTDWEAIGLPDKSPFDILSRPRAQAPAEPAPKPSKPRMTNHEKTLASLREPAERRRKTQETPC